MKKIGTRPSLSRAVLKNQIGQVVIEYVLLMVILAGIGAFIVRSFVSRSSDEPGILVAKWNRLLEIVALDNPED